ncbi:DeoR family transcriptional regulator [Escherichia coli]|uniref:DeoR family transcriptional regulator n=1 Tax=Escherichia coli TaxID=562 RepID=A0A377AI83_ECOLX|nr:DeoR family transcriptional regulator [Escherichia coli]
MIPVERRQIILEMVAEKGIVSIAELTDRMNVSHMTIRRDLQKTGAAGSRCAGVRRRPVSGTRGA